MAAVAYGTESIPAVDKIVGPGNAYVAAAKRYVSGDVGIDMVVGPSEVCVLADASADPSWWRPTSWPGRARPLASCYLVTCDPSCPTACSPPRERLVSQSPREEITRASLDDRGVIVVAETWTRPWTPSTWWRPSTSSCTAPTPWPFSAASATPAPSSWAPGARAPGRLRCRPQPHAAHGRHRALGQPLGVYDFQKRSSVIATRPRGFSPTRRPRRPSPSPRASGARALRGPAPPPRRGRHRSTWTTSTVAWPSDLMKGTVPFSSSEA